MEDNSRECEQRYHACTCGYEAYLEQKARCIKITSPVDVIGRSRVVPTVPTREMIDAWRLDQAQGRSLESSYVKMISVAPEVAELSDDESEMEHQIAQEHDFAAHVSHLQRSREWE